MSKTSSISSLAELHERQVELKKEQEAAKAGLASSLKRTPNTVSRFAYEDLALPVMGLGLAAYVGYRLLRRKPTQGSETIVTPPEVPSVPTATGPAPQPAPLNQRQEARILSSARQPITENGGGFNFKPLLDAGKILFPAAKAIVGVIQQQRAQQGVSPEKEE